MTEINKNKSIPVLYILSAENIEFNDDLLCKFSQKQHKHKVDDKAQTIHIYIYRDSQSCSMVDTQILYVIHLRANDIQYSRTQIFCHSHPQIYHREIYFIQTYHHNRIDIFHIDTLKPHMTVSAPFTNILHKHISNIYSQIVYIDVCITQKYLHRYTYHIDIFKKYVPSQFCSSAPSEQSLVLSQSQVSKMHFLSVHRNVPLCVPHKVESA